MFFFGSLANLCGLTMTCDILPQFISRERKLVDGAKEELSWQTESGWLSGASSSVQAKIILQQRFSFHTTEDMV